MCCAGAGCAPVNHAWSEYRDETAASDQMMLVRETPATLGYRRLQANSSASPDLAEFLRQTGLPDFLAETRSGDRKYLIFYYLDRHQAFAARTKPDPRGLEFAGPYEMGKGELKILQAAKRQSDPSMAGR